MGRIKHIHFVGIGGVGMAGIAEVLLSQGYQISGSDLSDNVLTKKLREGGATIYLGHAADHIAQADVVVRSSAVSLDNPECVAAREAHIPIVPRAEMLGELMRFRHGIAIAGTHGKTTTTSLVTAILAEAKVDPTFVIGGQLNSAGSHAHLGAGHYLVAEADESDASFLYLKPMISVVTNIDADHLATYHNNFSELRQTFIDFLRQLPFYGLAVLCVDDPVVREILPEVPRPHVNYGFTDDADYRAHTIQQHGFRTHFVAERPHGYSSLAINLNLPGRHNILNALAAIAVATELGMPDDAIQSALEKFGGIGRRFQIYGDFVSQKGSHITLLDDYGHHPREIAATLEAARQSWPDRRLVMVYQPHRYTRTRDLFEDFCDVLAKPDQVFLLDVYSAGEKIIEGADSASLVRRMNEKGVPAKHISQHHAVAAELQNILQEGDVLLMQGAGNIGSMAMHLAASHLRESVPVVASEAS
ncbi:MAG: UDP-N-acetylmuramate--L-alanine ligase [Gammaproteobacteria bacterium]|nr:UDP-N-acetylmuramate--L-alanine ligase [Gammaproteobacteria bacterium]